MVFTNTSKILTPLSPQIYQHAGRCLYVAQLSPHRDPCVLKVGKTTSICQRIKAFKTTSPDAELVGIWPTLLDESMVLRNAESWGLRQGSASGRCEVFHAEDPFSFLRNVATLIDLLSKQLGATRDIIQI